MNTSKPKATKNIMDASKEREKPKKAKSIASDTATAGLKKSTLIVDSSKAQIIRSGPTSTAGKVAGKRGKQLHFI